MMIAFAWVLSTFAVSYGLGSIPFGLLITRIAGVGDIRLVGSGNIGATNVMRTGHKSLGFATLLFDAGKGMAAVLFVRSMYYPDFAYMAALLAVLGHMFPVWLRFKGGKGVATTLGVLLALNWSLGVVICALWVVAFLLSRMSSFSSIASIWSSPMVACILGDDQTVILCLTLALLITFSHRANIERMLNGTESSFRKEKKS